MVDVFISYPRAERAKAEPVKAALEALKLDVFFDLEGIDGGAEFPKVITRALDASKAIVCCWSPLYFQRPWCVMEAREGLARDGQPARILPLCMAQFERNAADVEFRNLNYFDLTRWSGEDAHEDWNRTLLTLGKLVGRELTQPLKKSLLGGLKPVGAAPEPASARAEIVADLRETWRNFPARKDEAAVGKFLARVQAAAPGSGLEFEVEHHLGELRRMRTERETREAAAEARRRAEEAAREERAAKPRKAAEAARGARPVAERTFAIELLNVADWPNPQMIAIPPGRFPMGAAQGEEGASADEFPQHEVRIEHVFALGCCAVTFAEWDAALAAGASLEKPSDQGWGRGSRPVINVSWNDAQAYLAWLNDRAGLAGRPDAYRLPSEAEWEYACRAGTTTPFHFGETISAAQANYDGNQTYGKGAKGDFRLKTTPVGSFPANAFGLHDMHGNVWEWCEDSWHENYQGAPSDGSIWSEENSSARVFRSHSWRNIPRNLRSAFRYLGDPAVRSNHGGFRLARTVSPPVR